MTDNSRGSVQVVDGPASTEVDQLGERLKFLENCMKAQRTALILRIQELKRAVENAKEEERQSWELLRQAREQYGHAETFHKEAFDAVAATSSAEAGKTAIQGRVQMQRARLAAFNQEILKDAVAEQNSSEKQLFTALCLAQMCKQLALSTSEQLKKAETCLLDLVLPNPNISELDNTSQVINLRIHVGHTIRDVKVYSDSPINNIDLNLLPVPTNKTWYYNNQAIDLGATPSDLGWRPGMLLDIYTG